MGEHAQVTLALARRIRLAPQGRAEQPLVPREGALRLPALPVDAPVPAAPWLLAEAPDHLAAVARLGPLAPAVAPVQRDHRRADAQILPAKAVALLTVECRVAEHPVVTDRQGSLGHDRAELRRVVGGAEADPRRREEVAGRLAGDRQLRPQAGVVPAVSTLEEVTGGVPALQAGGIDGGRRPGADQAVRLCVRGGAVEEQDEFPFFKSRLAA